jgi:hypothetical protein
VQSPVQNGAEQENQTQGNNPQLLERQEAQIEKVTAGNANGDESEFLKNGQAHEGSRRARKSAAWTFNEVRNQAHTESTEVATF